MKTVTRKATVKTAFGSLLSDPLEFVYAFVELEEGDTVPENEIPQGDEIRIYANQQRNAAARSKAQAKLFEARGIKKPDYSDADYAFNEMVKAAIKQGVPEEAAKKNIAALLGRK